MTTIAAIPQEVRDTFARLALDLKHRGFARYSADAILHQIRWHFQVEKGRREFKCNNDWTADLARWAMATWPDLHGFFQLRTKRDHQ